MANKDIFFNEIYGTYYRVVEEILRTAQAGTLKVNEINTIAEKHGFRESNIYIPNNLKEKKWRLLTDDMKTPLQKPISFPLTLLEKRWLKALLLDPRIRLFDVDDEGLENIEPLFYPEQFVYFDQYTDGDPFDDKDYQQRFRLLLKACEEKRLVELEFKNNRGGEEKHVYLPLQLEYSAKDDKFRLRLQLFRPHQLQQRAERKYADNHLHGITFIIGKLQAIMTVIQLLRALLHAGKMQQHALQRITFICQHKLQRAALLTAKHILRCALLQQHAAGKPPKVHHADAALSCLLLLRTQAELVVLSRVFQL